MKTKPSLRPVVEEAHCQECGFTFYAGEMAVAAIDDDGSAIWYCDLHEPKDADATQ